MVATHKWFVIFLFLMFAVCFPAALFAQDVIAYIGAAEGDVSITKSAGGDTVDASLGMFLHGGDLIKTGEESYASVIFQDDGSRLTLGANTQLTLNAERQQKKLSKRLRLGIGKLWVKVTKKKGADFQIKTPTTVASVKGTGFATEVPHNELDVTQYWISEGCVQVANETQQIIVCEGYQVRATEDELIVEVMEPGDMPVEPGSNTLIFEFDNMQGDDSLEIQFDVPGGE
jgi:hypothetical protein